MFSARPRGWRWRQLERGGYEPGQDFHNRGRRCEEQIAVMRALWTQEVGTFTAAGVPSRSWLEPCQCGILSPRVAGVAVDKPPSTGRGPASVGRLTAGLPDIP
jgi:alkanesulfonate monooxygenase SsuD/methylene tetrahydromethanopterin reductase-like flavin-dependent oxidoreductase (luciferase family)